MCYTIKLDQMPLPAGFKPAVPSTSLENRKAHCSYVRNATFRLVYNNTGYKLWDAVPLAGRENSHLTPALLSLSAPPSNKKQTDLSSLN